MLKLPGILVLVISLAVSGCATIYNPATEQREIIFVTTPMEVSIGNMLATKISKQFKISKDSRKINRLTEIGKKIANVSDRKDLIYRFSVIEDDDLNAFTTPGGYIYVHSGLMEKSNDDELACVIGHEAGHVAARHIAKKMQAQIGYDILINIASRKGGLRDLQRAASISYNLIMLGFSRQDETLADRIGVKYAYKAGYDPYAMITFLKKLKDAKKEEIGLVFLRTHPYLSERIKILELGIPAIIEKEEAPIVANKKRPLRVMCPTCKKIFSGRTRYCPYDGTKLQ